MIIHSGKHTSLQHFGKDRKQSYNDILQEPILALLDKYHGIRMRIATFKRRIKGYGLKRRDVEYDMAGIK